MIALTSKDGSVLSTFNVGLDEAYGLHKKFGLLSEKRASKKLASLQRRGHDFLKNQWFCKFKVFDNGDAFKVEAVDGCALTKVTSTHWKLKTHAGQEYELIRNFKDLTLIPEADEEAFSAGKLGKTIETFFYALFLILPILALLNIREDEEIVEEKPVEKRVVKVVQKVNTVKINRKRKISVKAKQVKKVNKAHVAVKKNLGFLSLIGDKSITNAVGGSPQKLKNVSKGAGKGGNAGSGGEVLASLGKGLKQTTVGNTGVKGLGGVKTETGGVGGGAGGFGVSEIASGMGEGISEVSISTQNLELEGGLSRYAINATIAKYLSQIRKCYENELVKYPTLEGVVEVTFHIAGSGSVQLARTKKSSLGNQNVPRCMNKKIRTWKFPKTKGGVLVKFDYPFILRPVGG